MKKIAVYLLLIVSYLLLKTPVAYAHVVVKPDSVGVAAFQTFTVGVPNEKDEPVVSLRLLIPEGLRSVTPNVKPGWNIRISKAVDMKGKTLNNGRDLTEEEANRIVEIEWSGGSIPKGQRDEFIFNAQVPSQATTLKWIAYQTYQNGEIVSWDQDSAKNMSDEQKEEMEKSGKGPYSTTMVVNDLKNTEGNTEGKVSQTNTPMIFSIVALALSAAAIGMQIRKKS